MVNAKENVKTVVENDDVKIVNKNVVVKVDNEKNTYTLSFKNKKGEVSETLVDKKTVDYLSNKKYSLTKDKRGYIRINIDNKLYNLHRYIYYNIYGNNEDKLKPVIDHINSIRDDNRIEYLRDVTYSNNSRNRNKSKGASSIYYGVSYDKNSDTYICFVRHDNYNYRFQFKNEMHAAYQYNMLIEQFNISAARVNDIPKPADFIFKEPRMKKSGLAHGIQHYRNKYCYVFKCKQYGGFDTPEAALIARNKMIEDYNVEIETKILNEPIKRNPDGIAIIELFNKKKEKVGETMVDDDIYYELMHYKWYLNYDGYVNGTVNKRTICLSRFIMKYNGKDYVDHVDGNPANNQKKNLRILSPGSNAQNKSSSKISTSKFVGVCYVTQHKLWAAQLRKHIGYFPTELEAAQARDKRAHELNTTQNTFYKLNFPI